MKPPFFRKVLPNGFTVILEKRPLPIVSVAIGVRNGGANETPQEKGISHFIEHMLYKGTPTRNTQQIAAAIEHSGGQLNGFTDEFLTAYWCKMPSSHLPTALEVLGDMTKHPLFDSQELEKERQVIYEEMKLYRDSPQRHVFDQIQHHLYEPTLGLPLIGTKETMEPITREVMQTKFSSIYAPNNMMLVAVGDADFDSLVSFAEQTFGSPEKQEVPSFPIVLKQGEQIETREGIDQANMVLAYHSPLAGDPLAPAAKVLAVLMGGGMSSRLFSEIREKRHLAYSVGAMDQVTAQYAYTVIYAGLMPEHVDKVKSLILEEFEHVATTLTEEEVEATKEHIVGMHQLASEDSMTQMERLLHYEVDSNAEELYSFVEKIRSVQLADVKKLAAKVKEGYSFFALVPQK